MTSSLIQLLLSLCRPFLPSPLLPSLLILSQHPISLFLHLLQFLKLLTSLSVGGGEGGERERGRERERRGRERGREGEKGGRKGAEGRGREGGRGGRGGGGEGEEGGRGMRMGRNKVFSLDRTRVSPFHSSYPGIKVLSSLDESDKHASQ